ncbi:MAG: prepilin-type N-terminal cleavage/methylation domain-containing protein [Mariprofundales bacterium]
MRQRYRLTNAGFTLLEIMLVITVMAVVSALVVPSLFTASAPDVATEATRLQQVMRLAVDESQLAGRPLRWWARRSSYGFEQLAADRSWQPAIGESFADRKLSGAVIDQVLENGVEQQIEQDLSVDRSFDSSLDKKREDPLIGRVLILPNGMVTMVDVALLAANDVSERALLHVRPGPAGVALEKKKQEGVK